MNMMGIPDEMLLIISVFTKDNFDNCSLLIRDFNDKKTPLDRIRFELLINTIMILIKHIIKKDIKRTEFIEFVEAVVEAVNYIAYSIPAEAFEESK